MPNTPTKRIALFGATGGTGSATVKALIKNADFNNSLIELHLMVRSKDKLFAMVPQIRAYPNVRIWEGQLTDKGTVAAVLQNADTIICALGENNNIPGVHVLQDLATTIVAVLNDFKLSCSGEWKKPRLLFLSSSSWNDRFAARKPALVLWLLRTAFHYPYLDLRIATAHFESVPNVLSLLLIQPSALVDDEPSGMEISTESVSMAVSYSDLGEGFVELATKDAYNQLDAVGVSSKGGNDVGKYWMELLSRVVRGLIQGYFPGYWAIKTWTSKR